MEIVDTNLTVGGIIGNGIKTGLKNAPSLILATLLWILTIWIPYLNVGTTIGLFTTVIAMSKGGVISPVEIFDGKYRRYMGEFFLLMGLRQLGTFFGLLFLVIPGMVIAIAWSQAVYLLVDKKLNPVEALKMSNDITYGHKWTIFLGIFLVSIVYMLTIVAVSFLLLRNGNELAGGIIILVLMLLFIPIVLGCMAHIYAQLSPKAMKG